jgi:hypothetical protein
MGTGATGNKSGAGAIGMMTEEERKSGLGGSDNGAETLDVSRVRIGQSCPQQYPHPAEPNHAAGSAGPLGEPMDIGQVAALLGCSAWTVRQRYLPQGLPHLQASSGGRIVFFREQVIAWILKRQQQKGGNRK